MGFSSNGLSKKYLLWGFGKETVQLKKSGNYEGGGVLIIREGGVTAWARISGEIEHC